MTRGVERFADLIRPDSFIVPTTRRDHQRVRRGLARGELVSVLPGVHVLAATTVDTTVRINALRHVDPDAVVVGAAAALVWWPEVEVPVVEATRRGQRRAVTGYRWTKARFPDELVVEHGGVRMASPALSTLQLTGVHGGNAVDEALRRRACTLHDLWVVHDLLVGRRGTRAWRDLLHDSRDEPWSPAERIFHRRYREAGCLVAHQTNYPVALDSGLVFLDLAIPDLQMSFEVDGYETHKQKGAFEWDRDRGTQLAGLNWHEVRWAASFVMFQGAATRRRIRAIIAARAAVFGIPVGEVLRPE